MSARARGALFGISAAAIWGGLYVVSDVVLRVIPPFTLLAIRLVMGALILGLLLRRRQGLRLPDRADAIRLLGIGIVGFGVSVGTQFVGTDRSTAVNGALVTSASPAFILLFAALLLREQLTVQRLASIVLATVGVVVIIDPSQADFSSSTFVGDVALAVAAVTWGLYSVLVRWISARYDTLVVTFYALLGGLLFVVPAALVELPGQPVGLIDEGAIAGVLYIGLVSTAGAMWLWNRAFSLVDASLASLFFFAQPLVGALLGVTLLGQAMTANLWIGSGLIIVGVLLSLLYPGRDQATEAGPIRESAGAEAANGPAV